MKTDIIVIGGGHAGIEATNIAAKKGLQVLLITGNIDLIGHMSCNPSIGGIAKGNIVKEIDALGGLMGKIIDKSGIHFRMLNTSKGSAVWGNRAQADKIAYRRIARAYLEQNGKISFLQGLVKRLIVEGDKVTGVILDSGEKIFTKALIIATGTFLNGIIHIGLNSFPAGRSGEPPSKDLTEDICSYGIKSGRLKTGTSPRIDGRTVNYEKLTVQKGDESPWAFSFSTKGILENKVECWVSKTSKLTHSIILDNLDRSPLYTGKIQSVGPRYCPSIEDKVVRFGEREGHTLFLEPESVECKELYLNGLSSSLPFDIQEKMVTSVSGLENAKILRPGYGIEYDYFSPTQLKQSLESKYINNIYFAGQVNGTSGYEEAACQGLIAGINAALKIKEEDELILGRDTSYIGVLIDDLVTKGTEEPYRMFTSRAEYRLILRQDNCDERLMPVAKRIGTIENEIYDQRKAVWGEKERIIEELSKEKTTPESISKIGIELNHSTTLFELLKRPEIFIEEITSLCKTKIPEDKQIRLTIESDIKYRGFVEKQKEEINKLKKIEEKVIPDEFDYDQIKGLLNESKMKLKKVNPRTLGQASRIAGVTPADISILALYLCKKEIENVSRETMGRDI